jgi:hypothetical protein
VNTVHEAYAFMGMPVCAVLKDGSFRYGIIREIQGDQIILQGFVGKQRLSKHKKKAKAQIKSLGGLGGMLGLLGGSGLGGLGGGLGGLAKGFGGGSGGGFLGSMGGWMKIGMGMLSYIMPMMKNFSI